MRLPRLSLARQMIAVTVAATVLTQTVILTSVFYYVDNKFDTHDDEFLFGKLRTTVERINTADDDLRPLIIEASTYDELAFRISAAPMGTQPVTEAERSDLLQEYLGDFELRASVRKLHIGHVLGVVFSDGIERCLVNLNSFNQGSDCPHWTISIKLEDGQWLNARSSGGADLTIFLAPIVLSALTSLLGIGGSVIILARGITRPLRDLSKAADLLGRGETARPIAVTGPIEVARTAGAFNRMQERLTRFVRDRTAMLAAINHDLRTPITSLRLRAEFIEDPALRDDMIETTEEMRTMVDSYLAFSRQEAVEEERAPVDLAGLLADLAAANPEVSLAPCQETLVSCRPVSIKRVFRNLIDNGVKYGQRVRIALQHDAEQLSITFRDDGPGIPRDMYEDIFTPFTRMDSSRNITDGSVGLGLSIARSLIRKQGGDITPFQDDESFGMRVSLPVEALSS